MRWVSVGAVAVTAVALFVSRGVLDQVVTPDGLVRVALLPPWPTLGGFAAVGLLAVLWLDHRTVPRGTATAVRPPLGPLLLPLFGLGVLVAPYLPVLPDAVPALQMLAGPVRSVIWLVVLAQVTWVLWQARVVRADWLSRWNLRQATLAVGLAAALAVGVVSTRFVGTVLYPAGDEPHYLVIAQSLWRDGDLQIEDNHTRGDYREYFPRELAPHYLTRGADGEIYSIHPIGMPVLMAPVYAMAGYLGVVLAFILMAAAAAAVMWRTAVRLTGSAGAATFGVAAVVLTPPFLFNAFAIYPEIPAALAVTVAFALAVNAGPSDTRRWLIVGLLCGALPWLSTKYSPMSAALAAISLARILWPSDGGAGIRGRLGTLLAVVLPYAVALAAWLAFFYAIWGIPLPQAPYGALVQTDVRNLVFGAPGLLFDQEYGLLPYAPVYALAATGLWAMWRADAPSRRQAVETALVFAALLGTVGAFRIWWGGSASPGRPVTSGLLLLALPMAFAFRAAAPGSARRAAHHLLLWASLGVAGVMTLAQQGLLTANGRDGTSSLLEYLSPRWPAWTLAPTFIHHEAPTALVHSALWLLLAAAAALIIARVRTPRPGAASLAALLTTAGALLVAVIVMPRLPLEPAWPGLDVRYRPRLPLLDRFDSVARPLAVAYTPLRLLAPSELVAHAAVEVSPGTRSEPQPVRVLHNGRFSLPAGAYRIEVEWSGARTGETIALQIGRTGDPWQRWPVDARPGERWTAEFTLPVDAGFVGLRGTPELERVIGHIRFVPLAVVDVARRPRGPAVIAASQSGPASIFYYDTGASPEEAGFWVWGRRSTRVLIARDPAHGPLVLRVHSGPVANTLRLATFGWTHSVALQPQLRDDVEVPTGDRALVVLELSADEAFVPQALDPASTDVRSLGVWVEVVQ